ncbi:peptidylprolyl isomerase [soil metagenome]
MTNQIVSFHCVLKDRLGRVISSSFNQNVSTGQDPSGQLRGFTRGMQDLKKGERRSIFVGAEEAYGFYDLKKVVEMTRDDLPSHDSVRIGDVVLMALGEEDMPAQHRVTALMGDSVTLDANHPLAGQDLIFEIEATDVRDENESDNEEEEDEDVTAAGYVSQILH